jgi:hypothetical protein
MHSGRKTGSRAAVGADVLGRSGDDHGIEKYFNQNNF